MTPALMASSRVRYSLTETLSLAARRVKKKLISMEAPGRVRIHANESLLEPVVTRGDNSAGVQPVSHRSRVLDGRLPAGGARVRLAGRRGVAGRLAQGDEPLGAARGAQCAVGGVLRCRPEAGRRAAGGGG